MVYNGKEMREFDGTRVKIIVTTECNTQCKHCYLTTKGIRDPKEVNKIIRNNNNLLNNNKEEDDYFKNWFSNPKKIEINKNNKKNDIKDNDKKKR